MAINWIGFTEQCRHLFRIYHEEEVESYEIAKGDYDPGRRNTGFTVERLGLTGTYAVRRI